MGMVMVTFGTCAYFTCGTVLNVDDFFKMANTWVLPSNYLLSNGRVGRIYWQQTHTDQLFEILMSIYCTPGNVSNGIMET